MTQAFFVTGTDTGVGKTYALCAMLYRVRLAGLPAVGLKPVAAGVEADGRNEDMEAIRAASSLALPEEILNCYLFSPPVAPHIAADEAGRPIRFAPVLEALADAKKRVGETGAVLVEGVGGFRVPLGEEGDSADLAVRLGLPVILVVGMRLGCINHALLTAEAVAARGLPLAGWIANSLPETMPRFAENIDTLKQCLSAQLLGVLPVGFPGEPTRAAEYLSLPF
ncbi:MAG: dethiobiotin synthase [Zoogloeaceae bacterium]|jgi:dethiobiotin synthetase|nr:dethiobiotin synthase [Zoogloeaceae bacterium]